jgi:hypothetical protein
MTKTTGNLGWCPGSWRRSEVRLRLGGLRLVRQGHRGAQGQDWAGRMTECQLCQLMGCNKTGMLYFPLLDTHQNMCLAGELKWVGQPDTRGKWCSNFYRFYEPTNNLLKRRCRLNCHVGYGEHLNLWLLLCWITWSLTAFFGIILSAIKLLCGSGNWNFG